MAGSNLQESLNRTVKIALDTGEARSLEDAEKLFRGYRLYLHLGPEVSSSFVHQVVAATVVNTAKRCFLGGVYVGGSGLGSRNLLPWPKTTSLLQAISVLGGQPVEAGIGKSPTISIGSGLQPLSEDQFAVRPTFEGWSAGIAPIADRIVLPERNAFVPAGVLAGSIAVSEAFQYVRGGNASAGKRRAGFSLWRPGADFMDLQASAGPQVKSLPAKLWIIGLGHLGQAVLWTLGLLPYERPGDATFYLQDYDIISQANVSTSLLTEANAVGRMKTRAMAEWCENRGFGARLVERKFGDDLRVGGEDPRIGICVVDNTIARAAVEDARFDRVLEAGLGGSSNEYLSFQMHGFPGSYSARAKWGGVAAADTKNQIDLLNPMRPNSSYRLLLESQQLDECGVTLLAGKAVGASFVGAATAAIIVAELFRFSITSDRFELIDGTLRSPSGVSAVHAVTLPPYSPALTRLAGG
jgi:hypothetical protein